MSNPILYFVPDEGTLAYNWNNFWYDATNFLPIETSGIVIPIHEFRSEPSSDLVFVEMNENWMLFQTSGGSLQKLAEYLGAPGAKVISQIISLPSPYGSKVEFNEDRFRDLVNLKTLGIPLV